MDLPSYIELDLADDVEAHALDCICDECTEDRVLALLERRED